MRSQNDSPSDTATAGQTVPPVGIPRDVHRIKPFFNSRKRRRNLFLFCLFAGPGLLWFALLMLWPLINMFQVSLLDWWGIVRPSTFVGIDNYLQLLSDQRFHAALSHTLLQLVVVPTVVMPLSFMMGYFLSNRYPGYRLFRVIFFVPVILSVSARAMMFTGIYAPNGIINSFLTTVGLESMTRVWLGNITTVLPALFAVDIWGGIGFNAILFFAALSNIPNEIYEVADLDGANYWTQMWKIAFPLTLDFFGVLLMLDFFWVLMGSAQNVLLLTQGGPGDYSLTLGYYLYNQAFDVRRLGYSQAIGVVILISGIIGMLVIRSVTRRNYQQ